MSSVVKNPPANAGDTGLIHGRIPHAMEQLTCAPQLLRLCSRARSCNCRSPRALEPLVHKKTGHREEEPRAATRGGPHLLQLEKDLAQPQVKNKTNK